MMKLSFFELMLRFGFELMIRVSLEDEGLKDLS